MFELNSKIDFQPISYNEDSCSSAVKRIKFLDDGSILLLENSYDTFVIYHINSDNTIQNKWSITEPDGVLIDYLYINGKMYIYFISSISDYDEQLSFYRSEGSGFELIDTVIRESYQHDMDFFSMFEYKNECRLILIRHNRVHLYKVDNFLEEISVMTGKKWIINGEYAVNIDEEKWELYDSTFEMICDFTFKSNIDWMGLSVSRDKSLISIAIDNTEGEAGGLLVYDKHTGSHHVHYQRYGFFSAGIACGYIWTTVVSMYSDVGGLMVFDKYASLKFAHIRDESEDGEVKNFNPAPIVYQALGIEELYDNKVFIADTSKILITDSTCRILQVIDHYGYDCVNLSKDAKKLAILKVDEKNSDGKNKCEIEIYDWNSKKLKAKVIDLTTYIGND